MEQFKDIILDSIKNKETNLTESEIYSYAKNSEIVFLDALFVCINELVNNFSKNLKTEKIDILFNYLDIFASKFDVDYSIYRKYLRKLEKEILLLKKEKLKNKKKASKKLNKLEKKIENFETNIRQDSTEIENDFINYLLLRPRDLNYFNILFEKIPEIMEIQDLSGSSLFFNIAKKYLYSTKIEEKLYCKNLILLLTSKKDFQIKDDDNRKIKNMIIDKKSKLNLTSDINQEEEDNLKFLERIIDNYNIKNTKLENIAEKYNIEINFNKRFIDIIKDKEATLKKDKQDRMTFKDYILSIDSKSAIEIDDALSCRKLENGNYLLGVHIASILGYFEYYSEIVQNAFERNHSIYFHNKNLGKQNMLPIFPLEFSANYGSLIEGKDRLTRSYIFEIDKEGNIKKFDWLKTVIKNNNQTTYENINNILKNGTDDTELSNTVKNLFEVTKILSQKYNPNEVYELVKENSSNVSELKVKRHGSEQIVYQAMLLTGNKVAEFFAENDYPCLYRTHKVSDSVNEQVKNMVRNIIKTNGINDPQTIGTVLGDIYPKSTYDIEGRHDGLNLDHYCHCTSGLRRSADILVEHALEVCYDNDPSIDDLKELRNEIISKKDLLNSKEERQNWLIQEVNKNYTKIK